MSREKNVLSILEGLNTKNLSVEDIYLIGFRDGIMAADLEMDSYLDKCDYDNSEIKKAYKVIKHTPIKKGDGWKFNKLDSIKVN